MICYFENYCRAVLHHHTLSKVTGADVMSYCPIYNDSASKTIYEIPLSSLGLRKSYGPALVAAWKNLFALFYIDSNDNHITKLSDCGTGTNLTCTSSYNSSKHTLTLTFNSTVWYGITVLSI